jgi:organic radical activating enzyme
MPMDQQKILDNIDGFHIEPTNICTLKCAGCARTRFINQWPQHWKNHSLDISHLLNFLDIDLTKLTITLCGNYGDPIYHPTFVDFVAQLKNRGSIIHITTNGSYRTKQWWNELTSVLTDVDCVTFSVDGMPSNFTQYRVNADWESIHQGMSIVANSQCRTTWKYIPFSFNVTDIESAKQLSQEIGIDNFFVNPSDRFDEQTEFLKPDKNLLSNRYEAQVAWKSNNTTDLKINPRCSNKKEHFITADGHYSPCCFSADYRFYYKTIFGKQKNMYDIQKYTFSQMLEQTSVIQFYQTLENHSVCQYSCPG